MRKFIIVQFQIEGLHCWPEASNFLKHPHRHIFHIRCRKEVSHGDREIEIIEFKRKIEGSLILKFFSSDDDCCNFGRMSCEDIAELLVSTHDLDYCRVLEDNENGAVVTKR